MGRLKGFKHSKETKINIGLSILGNKYPNRKRLSIEDCLKLSKAHNKENSSYWLGIL